MIVKETDGSVSDLVVKVDKKKKKKLTEEVLDILKEGA